jgi:choline dehydrogenase-like flavoprotein
MEHYDVIIIGTGAGGGTLAYHLAPSGKRILLLERGAFLTREKQNWDVNAVFLENRYVSQDTWYDHHRKPFQPGSHYFVGGATKLYGAALFRMRQEDFGELKHHDGISPAWPITYEDLEPYYTQAEHLYQVHGLRGADPTDPPASAPYLFPPLSHEPRIQELYDDLAKAGYHPSPAPTGIRLNEQAHPHGLANGSHQVGRNYMFHNSTAVVALSRRENPTMFQKTLSLNDFYFGANDCEYPLGNIQMIGKSQGVMFRGDAPRLVPGMTLDQMARHAVDFWLTTEDLPDPNNRISVNARGEIQLQYTFNNQEPTRRLEAKLHAMLEHLGCHKHLIPNNLYLGKHIPIAGVGHQAGTCRFGTDPATSVLDINCKAHELDNLYVVDTSFFPSIAAVNPSLTAMANALRVGDHLLERLG